MQSIIDELRETAGAIRRLEKEAGQLLYQQKDEAGYRRNLAEKTEILIGLDQRLEKPLAGLEPQLRERVTARLQRFAGSAKRAKQLDSIFYMAALLYPEEYREGEKNDLEKFADELERELQSLPDAAQRCRPPRGVEQ